MLICNISNPTMRTGLDSMSAQFDLTRLEAKPRTESKCEDLKSRHLIRIYHYLKWGEVWEIYICMTDAIFITKASIIESTLFIPVTCNSFGHESEKQIAKRFANFSSDTSSVCQQNLEI
jgi:hypothetical protein